MGALYYSLSDLFKGMAFFIFKDSLMRNKYLLSVTLLVLSIYLFIYFLSFASALPLNLNSVFSAILYSVRRIIYLIMQYLLTHIPN